ncbi:hypothetical protein B0H10DRAFT_1816647, partial [Mycena sp. CBHHK59/15]
NVPCSRHLSSFDSAKPSNAVVRLYDDLSRLQCSILTQLRTTHIGLNAYLYQFHLAPSPDCVLCLVPEMVPHFLLSCPIYHHQRLDLIRWLSTARLSLCRLLLVKAEPGPVLGFMRDTGCFPCYAL